MIRYALQCGSGHAFESWFQDSGAYDRQRKRALIACPQCGSTGVDKAIMAPRVTSSRKREAARRTVPNPQPAPEAAGALMSPADMALRAKLKELRDYVKSHAEDVGSRFPDEARKMHEGEIAHRPIYGESTPQETKALLEDGIDIMPLPMLPDDRN